MALCGLALLGVTYAWVSALSDRRAGVYATLVLGSTPFFLLHSREMVGATPAFLGSALVMLGTSTALFGREQRGVRLGLWLALAALGAMGGAYSAGVLSTVAPPLLAVSAVVLITGHYKHAEGAQRSAGFVVLGANPARGAAAAARACCAMPRTSAVARWSAARWRPGHLRAAGRAPFSRLRALERRAAGGTRLPPALRATRADQAAGADGASRFGLGLLCSSGQASPTPLSRSRCRRLALRLTWRRALAVAAALWLREREESDESDFGELIVIVLLLA